MSCMSLAVVVGVAPRLPKMQKQGKALYLVKLLAIVITKQKATQRMISSLISRVGSSSQQEHVMAIKHTVKRYTMW